jgi:hypothetical protein
VFRRLLTTIGLNPGRGGRRPRIHDFRHNRERLITRIAEPIAR